MNRINFNQAKTLASHLALAMGLTALVACGGGGGGGSKSSSSSVSTASSMSSSSSSVAPDTTPDGFTFSAKTDVKRGNAITSEAVTIAGIDAAASVSITNGEYAIGDADAFVSTAGTITVGQSIKVRVTAPSGFDETQAAELNIGGVKASFSVTTEKQDTEPKAFTFNPVTDADFDSEHTSNELTIEEINDTATIAITNGFYSVNGGEFVNTEGTVDLDDTVAVKGVAASKTDTTKDITLTVGGVSGVFSITTFSDTTPPTAKIAFPPPVSKTANESMIVRGTVEDDFNEIESVKLYVNGNDSGAQISIDSTVSPAMWRTEDGDDLVLSAGENTIKVVVRDVVGNEDVDAATVNIVKAEFDSAFPNNVVPLTFADDICIYNSPDAKRLLVSNHVQGDSIVVIDLASGERSEVSISGVPSGLSGFVHMEMNETNRKLYLSHIDMSDGPQGLMSIDISQPIDQWSVEDYIVLPSQSASNIFGLAFDGFASPARILFGSVTDNFVGQVDAALDSYLVFPAKQLPENANPFDQPIDVYVDQKNGSVYVLEEASPNIYMVDREDDTTTIISNGSLFVGDANTWQYSVAMTGDPRDGFDRLLVVGDEENTLLSVDVGTGKRERFSDDDVMPFERAVAIEADEEFGYVFVLDSVGKTVFAIDLETGERVIVAKSN